MLWLSGGVMFAPLGSETADGLDMQCVRLSHFPGSNLTRTSTDSAPTSSDTTRSPVTSFLSSSRRPRVLRRAASASSALPHPVMRWLPPAGSTGTIRSSRAGAYRLTVMRSSTASRSVSTAPIFAQHDRMLIHTQAWQHYLRKGAEQAIC